MKALIVCKHPHEEMSLETKRLLESFFHKILYSWKNTLRKNALEDINWVISIGGDGTALSAAHFNENKPLLAVNSSPETSVGALTTIHLENLKEKLEEIKHHKYKTELLERIEVSINGKKIDHLALNDVFIANEKAYYISRYKVYFKGKEEFQMSSGLLFSTGTGSTAWFESAGGKPFSPQSKFIKMIARELYHHNKYQKPLLQNIEIEENESIMIIPHVKSILAVDSIQEYHLKKGDMVKIKISKHPLKRII